MEYYLIDQKYLDFCDKYHIDVKIIHSDDVAKIQIEGKIIYININNIKIEEYEEYLSFGVRKIVLPLLIIQTKNLILRRFEPSDAQDYFEFLSDKDTCYLNGYEPFITMDDEYHRLMDKFADDLRFSIVLKDTRKVIGTINLNNVNDRVIETMELGYVISPNYRRKGYCFEAIDNLVKLLFNDLHLDMIILGAIKENIPSLNLIKKLGFAYEGNKTKAFYHPLDGPLDVLYYKKERDES